MTRDVLLHHSARPVLIDLFCKAGGAGKGYHDAGFDVVGVDIEPQPNYPFRFIRADALDVLEHIVIKGRYYDVMPVAVHASPPCQAFSALATMWNARADHPELIEPTRALLEQTGLPWVIENVVGAPLENPVVLCGSMFGLGVNGRQLRRHRLFESSVAIMTPPCQHRGEVVGVYGNGGGGQMARGYKARGKEEARAALGTPWMSLRECSQAIPPAFTEHIGGYLMAALESAERAA